MTNIVWFFFIFGVFSFGYFAYLFAKNTYKKYTQDKSL
ncbi:Uncharacterised protein [Acinetobacter baumannii]|nr:Uncharacterised protein [Acinetobacter baumannii]